MRTIFKNMCRNISNSYYLTTKIHNTYLQRKDYQDAKMQEHSTCNEEKDETIERLRNGKDDGSSAYVHLNSYE